MAAGVVGGSLVVPGDFVPMLMFLAAGIESHRATLWVLRRIRRGGRAWAPASSARWRSVRDFLGETIAYWPLGAMAMALKSGQHLY